MTVWRKNSGHPPVRESEDAPPIDRIFVRLRCGLRPAESWPSATGRHQTARWSLTGDPFDITHWRPA